MQFALVPLLAAPASAGNLSGTVHNGTDGKPGAHLDVILIQLQGGMQPVATVKTDAQGAFQFDRPEINGAPLLIRVPYRGVNYHQPVPPGASSVQVEIFDPTTKQSAVSIVQHDIVVQPSGTTLLIGEEYGIENDTQPPVAFFKVDGTFNFNVPEGATLGQVSAWSAAGMPVVQGTIDKGKNQSAIAFPFRPGKNGVRISYQMPYPSNQATVRMISLYAAKNVLLVAPPTVQVSSTGFAPAGTQDGWNIYSRGAVAASLPLEISISGSGPPPSSASTGGAEDPSTNSRAATNSATEAGEAVTALPGRLDSVKWIIVAGFAILFAIGAAILMRHPRLAVAGATPPVAPPVSPPFAPKKSKPVLAAPASSPSSAVAQVDAAVHGSLDAIKDQMFRLELRHQAGTISDEDYRRERAQIEATIRNLVRG